MAKMTKAERAECERNLATCRAAVSTFEKMLANDDSADKAAGKAADRATIRGIADRDGTRTAIQVIRETQGRRPGEMD